MNFNFSIGTTELQLKLYLCKNIKDVNQYHTKVDMNLDVIHISLNPTYVKKKT